MKHLSEEHLILHYYGETDASAHLNACPLCRESLASLQQTLDSMNALEAPERAADYESLLWQRIGSHVRQAPVAWWRRPMILAPLLSGLIVAAFWAGRISTRSHPIQPLSISDAGRARIFDVALSDHLDRLQILLLETQNASPGDASAMRISRQRAVDLLSENRLYRATARDSALAPLLDESGRILSEIAHSDDSIETWSNIRRRIAERNLIFKIRIVGINLQREGSQQL